MINVLWLDSCFHSIFQYFSKVVLEFASAKMDQDFFPIGRVVVTTQIGFHFAGKNFQSCRLPNTVGSDETENLSRAWHRQAMKFERVGTVAMCGVLFQIFGQVDNTNGFERALFDADTTT